MSVRTALTLQIENLLKMKEKEEGTGNTQNTKWKLKGSM